MTNHNNNDERKRKIHAKVNDRHAKKQNKTKPNNTTQNKTKHNKKQAYLYKHTYIRKNKLK